MSAECSAGNIPPGYKQTEVGVIPEDWDFDYIENFSHITTGGRNTQDRIDDGLYPFFVRSQTVERINSYSFDGEAVLTAGDGVGTGKVFHYINGKFDAHQRVYRISDFNERINGYFFYLYFSNHFYNRIMQMTAKSSVDSVRREMIARMFIPLPPKTEQESIAQALSDADALVESLEQLISKKRQIKQGAMQELLTGKRRLSGFIEEWKVKRLGDVVEKIVGGGTPSRSNPDFWDGDIPWVTVKDFVTFNPYCTQETITNEGLKNSASNLIPKGNVIASTRMALGKAVIYKVDVSINQDLKAIFPSRELDNVFLYYWFQKYAEFIDNLGSGSTVKGVSLTDLRSIEFLTPSISEQHAIATILSDVDSEITMLEEKLAKARQLKQGMMQELLTGRIRLI